ncbi:hypothetical protein N9373_00070 [Flavobacteriaceae bacterium]|nr:hypothetical protein [Flavobacteriaceae bacterium]
MKNNGGFITVSIGLILMVYDYVSNDYEFDGYLRGSIFILLGLIIVFGQYIWGKSMNFYGDFDKFQLVASDSEQLKVLLKGNNWWDRAHINFDFDKNKPIIEKSSISIPFISSNADGRINFYIKFEKEDLRSPKKGLIKMKTNFFMQTFGIFVCRSIRRTIKTNLSKP